MARKRRPATQITDGAWYSIGHGYTHEDCCSCGLSHRVDYKLDCGRIFVRYRVDQRRTRANRKHDGIVVLRRERGVYR